MMKTWFLVFALVIASTFAAEAGETDEELEKALKICADPVRIQAGDWGYEFPFGPFRWGILRPEYKLCSTGKKQSPINVVAGTPKPAGQRPKITMMKSMMEFQSVVNNFNFNCKNPECAPCSKIVSGGRTYMMAQVHFHAPSEMIWDGISFPLEAHFVHVSKDSRLSVIGVFFQEGAFNEQLQKLIDAAKGRTDAVVDIPQFYSGNGTVRMFGGSLTTPPCSEGVKWIVSGEVMSASKVQIAEFQVMYNNTPNNRPIQRLGTREIKQYA